MFAGPRSIATLRTRLITPALAAAYGKRFASPSRPVFEAVTTIAPPPLRRSTGTLARMPSTAARRFTSIARSNTSMSIVSTWPEPRTPALSTTIPSRPSRSASSTAATFTASSVTSPTSGLTAPTPSNTERTPSVRSTATTLWPRSTSRSTVARPMPEAEPVTIATGVPTSLFVRTTRGSLTAAPSNHEGAPHG